MTVRELIDQLNLLPDDLEVCIKDYNGEYVSGVEDITRVEVSPWDGEEYSKDREEVCCLVQTHELTAKV